MPMFKSPMFVGIVSGTIAALIAGILLQAIPGHPIAIGLVCIALVMSVVFLVCANWYWMILDYRDSPEGSKARDAYNHLRSNLRGINKPRDTPFGERYRNEITNKLNGIARWFGDADYQVRPLWTPESYDRCLLLACLYPTVSLLVIWIIGGTSGPAEQALGLTSIDSMLGRVGLGVALLGSLSMKISSI